MSEDAKFRVGLAAASIDAYPAMDGISSVTLFADEDGEGVMLGSASGRNLDVVSPWITEAAGRELLARLKSYQYQPYKAVDAILDPAAEIGDAVTLGKMYGGIYAADISFNSLMRATISAPAAEDLDEETPYKSPESRRISRKFRDVRAALVVQADRISAEVEAREADAETLRAALNVQAREISAKVSRTGGDAASFGWSLTADGWTLSSGGSLVLKADRDGLQVSGRVMATAGKVGGFAIEDGYLRTNGQTWGGTNTSGIYIGPDGIQLGRYFRVDASGNLTAKSGTFSGSVRAGSIEYGGDDGYLDGAGLADYSVSGEQIGTDAISNRHITSGSIYPSTCNSTINGYFADVIYANKVFAGSVWVSGLRARQAEVERLRFGSGGMEIKLLSPGSARLVLGT